MKKLLLLISMLFPAFAFPQEQTRNSLVNYYEAIDYVVRDEYSFCLKEGQERVIYRTFYADNDYQVFVVPTSASVYDTDLSITYLNDDAFTSDTDDADWAAVGLSCYNEITMKIIVKNVSSAYSNYCYSFNLVVMSKK